MSSKRFRTAAWALVVLTPVMFALGTGTAHATLSKTMKIRLLNHTSYCAAVAGGRNVTGRHVWLVPCANGRSETWVEEIAPNQTGFLCGNGPLCVIFRDRQNTNLCLGMDGGNTQALLGRCDNPYQNWLVSGSELRNAEFSSESILTAFGVYDEAQIGGGVGKRGTYYHWTGPTSP